MTALRPLLTAAAAATLLSALWFVPSAKAAPADGPRHPATTPHETAATDRLADTTTPYVVGGAAFLGLGAGFVAYSARRESTAD
ncbi:hypothetical protein [Streptomyces sp. NRRL B-1347]|uniref:hypothetical protein n=1 Tax=Streptomyces sp. NRRL B-1347 TaxID=1476877 RepID=UPI0004CAA67B|nr:hypothetical protein [Streptomyces sp. NRRL B-1347]